MAKLFKNKKIVFWLSIFFLIAIISTLSINYLTKNKNAFSTADNLQDHIYNLGEGKTGFILEINLPDGKVKKLVIKSDAEYLGQALSTLGIIEGESSEYGMMVHTVDKVKLDFEKDKMYWALYVGDDYATAGVDQTLIEDGGIYKFKAEK